jgi:NAD dependent epimerase/dehydratase family enzyme
MKQIAVAYVREFDMNRLFESSLTNSEMQGVYIASSPNPVAQVDFMRELRRAVGMPIGLPAFSWMVRIAAPLLLHTDPELALYGRFVISKRLEEEGFDFHLPHLADALRETLSGGDG